MAEVVGLIASVATLAEVAIKLQRLISRLRDAPDELLALSNEISDLRFLFTDVEKAIRGSPDSQARFSKTLDEAGCRIKDVESFLRKVDTVDLKLVDRIVWLRYKPKVCRLQSALRETRLQMTALLGVETISALRRVENLVKTIQLTVSTSAQMVQQTHDTVLTNMSLLGPFPGQHRTQPSVPTTSASCNTVVLNRRVGLQQKFTCKCKCHRKPQRLSLSNRFLGSLFIGYSNIPFLSAGCSEGLCQKTCKNRSSEASATYYFPTSVTSKVLNIAFASSLFSGPLFSLTLWNTRRNDSPWFVLAEDGDIEGLKSLLESGSARLTDVNENGETALNSALDENQYYVCEWLLQAGVDPSHVSHFGTSFIEELPILYLGYNSKLGDLLYVISSSPEEELQLSEIHKAILKIGSKSVLESILEPGSNINATDAYGKTPLWWAAAFDESKSAKTLLEHGADPNIKDTSLGSTAFHMAACGDFPCDILDLFIRYGANTTAVTKRKLSILHCICRNTNEDFWSNGHQDGILRFMKYCLHLGHPLDPQDSLGETPLFDAVRHSNHHAVAFLLDFGADYTIRNNNGNGILHLAASSAYMETLDVLSAHGLPGIDIHLKNRAGYTALDIFESPKGYQTQEEIKAFYHLWGEVSMRTRGASRTGFVAGVLSDREIVEDGQQEDESVESADREGPEDEDYDASEVSSEDEDESKDLFVDALEG